MRVLIVDDNSGVRRLIRRLVSDLADSIDECDDGAEAVTMYEALLPDWVLMDIGMKHVDGLEATSAIKSAYPDARILIVTNFDDPGLRDAARKAGACGYVVKDDLFRVREIIGETGATEKIVQPVSRDEQT